VAEAEKASRGKQIATVAAAMIAGEVILGLVGVQGAVLHNALLFGGVGLGVVGIVMWRVLKK
jgi:hypothetical protein